MRGRAKKGGMKKREKGGKEEKKRREIRRGLGQAVKNKDSVTS